MTTLYDAVVNVARDRLGVTPNLRPNESKTGALLGDISLQVQEKAAALYPEQDFMKVAIWLNGRKYNVRVYPQYMIDELIYGLIEDFIEREKPFDKYGEVIYGRHVATPAEREATKVAKVTAKYGSYDPNYSARMASTAPAVTTTRVARAVTTTRVAPTVNTARMASTANTASSASTACATCTQGSQKTGRVSYKITKR